jgi:L-ascorbate metabolism protein UlaG (beta-lactamase superfamily)
MPKLFYQGHASVRITTDEGTTIYIDPYVGKGYEKPADLVLITHEHYDHNAINLIHMSPSTVVIRARDMHKGNGYSEADEFGVHIKAVPAYNSHHRKEECVGYLLTINKVKIYHAGDTDLIPEMEDLTKEKIDYALLPVDGFYTMSPDDATRAAEIMGVKHLIPIHTHVGMLWDRNQAEKVRSPVTMLVQPGEEIDLQAEGTI